MMIQQHCAACTSMVVSGSHSVLAGRRSTRHFSGLLTVDMAILTPIEVYGDVARSWERLLEPRSFLRNLVTSSSSYRALWCLS